MMKRIVSLFGQPEPVMNELNARAAEYAAGKGLDYDWIIQDGSDNRKLVQHMLQADAAIIDHSRFGEEIFSRIAGKTRLLVRFGVGYDQVDLAAASRHGIAVARTTGANMQGVAEMALSLIFACRRQLRPNMQCVKNGNWGDRLMSSETVGGTVGIIGFGAVGKTLARMMRGLDCKVLIFDPYLTPQMAEECGVTGVSLDELARLSDAVSVHAPYSKETHHLVDAGFLAKMKPEAVLVNTSRGNIVDEDALCDALSSRSICGAGLDVFAQEPLPLTSRLLGLDNIILAPHMSSSTRESFWNTYAMAIDIAADFFGGKDCPHILNPEYLGMHIA